MHTTTVFSFYYLKKRSTSVVVKAQRIAVWTDL